MRVALAATMPVKLNASGAGSVKVGPLSAREVWWPETVHVSCASNVLESTCKIYVGPDTTQSNFRDQTPFGSTGDSTGSVSADKLTTGMYVWAVWTGADANTTATLTVTGQKDI